MHQWCLGGYHDWVRMLNFAFCMIIWQVMLDFMRDFELKQEDTNVSQVSNRSKFLSFFIVEDPEVKHLLPNHKECSINHPILTISKTHSITHSQISQFSHSSSFLFLAFAQNSDTKLLQVVATKKILMQYISIFKSLLQQKIIQAHIYVYCNYNVSLLQNSFFFLAMNLLFPIVSIDLSNKKLTKKEMSSN